MIKSFKNQLIYISLLTAIAVFIFGFYTFSHTDELNNLLKTSNLPHDRLVLEIGKKMDFYARASFIFLITLITIFASFTIGMVMTVIYSFREIISGIRKINEGDFKHRINLNSTNEFGVIADFLNKATENIVIDQIKIREAGLSLEKKVFERTKELSEKMQIVESQLKDLGDNRKAMLNILEDQKELEEALRIEKSGIEAKVLERTKELSEKTEALIRANNEINMGWINLQQEKARLTASIQSLPQGFFMTDMNNNVLIANQLIAKILHIEKIDFDNIFNAFSKIVDLKKYYKSAILEQKMFEFKDLVYEHQHLRLFLVPIILNQNQKNEVIGVITLIEDITERKVAERSRDEFFSIASHELRTPLTAIKGNSSLIQEHYEKKVNEKDFSEMLSDIHESSVRLIGIVNDFLDSSRLEQGRMLFNKEVFDIIPIIEKVVYEEGVSLNEKNIYLKFDQPAGSLPLVNADKNKTKQIIYNLIGNAVKFTEIGGVTVTLSEKDKNIIVRVTDTGKGIPLQSQALLFRKFQQAENNILTRDSSRGTGLGLYISRLLAEGMGGTIYLEKSEEGKGATFVFKLPISEDQNAIQHESMSQI